MRPREQIKITILAENTASGKGILGEHGLSVWIDTGDHRLLFDTGQGLALPHNARELGIDVATADAIVPSHGNFDQVGGLHLLRASKRRMNETNSKLSARQVEQTVFCHCTGHRAVCELQQDLSGSCSPGHPGMALEV